MNCAQIADKHGMGRETVRWRLNRCGCRTSERRSPGTKREQSEDIPKREPIGQEGPTFVWADDGKAYSVNLLWPRDWACLSFSGGLIELLVAVDGGTPQRAITGWPVILGEPLIGVRVFEDRHGVRRTWRAHRARPSYTERGFPRSLIPADHEPTSHPNGALLFQRR